MLRNTVIIIPVNSRPTSCSQIHGNLRQTCKTLNFIVIVGLLRIKQKWKLRIPFNQHFNFPLSPLHDVINENKTIKYYKLLLLYTDVNTTLFLNITWWPMRPLDFSHVTPSFSDGIDLWPTRNKFLAREKTRARMHDIRTEFLVRVSWTENLGRLSWA